MNQTILLTVLPRGITLEGDTLPVSVFVTPRLFGATNLGAFPDWLNWTAWLKDNGLRVTFLCDGNTLLRDIDPEPLRPELWRALFNEETLVRSHSFDDYSDRAVFSYPVRLALSALKNVYQVGGILFALPERRKTEDDPGARRRFQLKRLISGFAVNWDEKRGEALRDALRHAQAGTVFVTAFGAQRFPEQSLSGDGLLAPGAMPAPASAQAKSFQEAVATPFAVFHHMPQPKSHTALKDEPPDMDNVLDFHQALTSLNNYPPLQRALGLVFDFDLPSDFVAQTTILEPKMISISEVEPGWKFEVATATPPLATAYLNAQVQGERTIFFTAPRGVVEKRPIQTMGLLNLDPTRFGLAQVDVDGAMHKAIMLAETLTGDAKLQPLPPQHPEVFDPTSTLPALRSGGFSLFADVRAVKLLERLQQSKRFNDALTNDNPQQQPIYAEDLVRGYRLDIWDSHTKKWHSLHRRNGIYTFGEGEVTETFETQDEEGFVQLAATQSAAPSTGGPPPKDLYLHEAIARWAGWSLGAPLPGKHLARSGDPDKAVPPDDPNDPDFDPENPTVTPFKMAPLFKVFPSSLPSLRFGRAYRLRARVVDLAGNSLALDEQVAELLSVLMALPRDPDGFVYLRYEPVISPLVIMRDQRALTAPGSAIDRLVIRTFNTDPSLDTAPADLTASDRHIVPPQTSVEIGERLGMFDDANGKLINTPAMYDLISQRDSGELQKPAQPIVVGGKAQDFPLEPDERIDALPFLPDALARGATFRNLPGTPSGTLGKVAPGAGGMTDVPYILLNDPNPRPGSATLVSFGGEQDWQQILPFRFALADGAAAPAWGPADRVLTVYLPKATTHVIPLSSYLNPEDLKLMGVWQWLREYIEHITIVAPEQQTLLPDFDVDQITHLLQRAVEGGHWMITPPRLLTLIHAVLQPIGAPQFTRLTVQRASKTGGLLPSLETQPESEPTREVELAAITAWRRLNSVEAFLLGGLRVHGASTAKIDVLATWEDPIDDLAADKPGVLQQAAHADEIPLERLGEGYLRASGAGFRSVGYYDPDEDLIAFARSGDALGSLPEGTTISQDAAPRHHFNDTKHRSVTYTAVSTSRYREYFPQDQGLDFTRKSGPVIVDVPASARPGAPRVLYVLPTFDWQRQGETNVKRSVRFGGGVRIYLERPWYSSGVDELLGVALWNFASGAADDAARARWKPFVTQWGADPIWQTASVPTLPSVSSFTGAIGEFSLSLEERTPDDINGKPGRVDVAGFPVEFDEGRKLWYCDLTIDASSPSYMPFVRLALVRYQPHALPDAKLSRVVLADFVQLTPDRSAVVTADPYHPRRLRVTISGPAPRGPSPALASPPPSQPVHVPTQIVVTVQRRNPAVSSDLTWEDAPAGVATINIDNAGFAQSKPDLGLWSGTVNFTQPPESGDYRLLIREFEYISANYTLANEETPGGQPRRLQPHRLIYAEAVEIDAALIARPPQPVTGAVTESCAVDRDQYDRREGFGQNPHTGFFS